MVKILTIYLYYLVLYLQKVKRYLWKNCVKCHDKLSVSIDKYFYRYLLKIVVKRCKEVMFDYLKKSNDWKTIMSESLVKRFGIKKRQNYLMKS